MVCVYIIFKFNECLQIVFLTNIQNMCKLKQSQVSKAIVNICTYKILPSLSQRWNTHAWLTKTLPEEISTSHRQKMLSRDLFHSTAYLPVLITSLLVSWVTLRDSFLKYMTCLLRYTLIFKNLNHTRFLYQAKKLQKLNETISILNISPLFPRCHHFLSF